MSETMASVWWELAVLCAVVGRVSFGLKRDRSWSRAYEVRLGGSARVGERYQEAVRICMILVTS